jgi:hypothetical protein
MAVAGRTWPTPKQERFHKLGTRWSKNRHPANPHRPGTGLDIGRLIAPTKRTGGQPRIQGESGNRYCEEYG